MRQQQTDSFEKLLTRRMWSGRMRRFVAMLSAFVLLTTMNTLKLNADTLERIATCGIAQHVHDESCYDADGEIACGLEEHVHTDACYQQRPTAEDKASTRIDEYVPLDAQVRLASPVEFISEDDEDTSVEISDVDDAVDEVMAELQNGDADDRGDEDDIDLLFTPDDEEALPVSGEDATEIDDTIFEIEGEEEIAAEDESEAEAEMIDGTIEDEVAEDATIEDVIIEDTIIGDESVEDESIEIGTTDEENTKYTYELGDSREVLLSTVLEALGIQLDQIDSASAAKSDEAVLSVALNEDGDYVITALEGFEKGEIVVVGMESETVAAYIIAITAAKAEEETEVGEADKAEEAPEIKTEEEVTEEKKDAEETVEEETEKAEENAEEQTEVEEIKDEDGAEEVQESDEESEAAEVAIVENDNVTIVPVGDNSLSGNLEIVYNENVNKQSVVDRLDAILSGAYQPGMMSTSSAAMSGRALAGASAGNETAGQYSDYAVFDISLLDDGVQRSETGEVGVVVRPENVNIYDNLPGNATATNVEYTLYHIHNSAADTLPVSVDCGEDGSLLAVDFTTDSFSYFVLKYTVEYEIVNDEVTVKVDFTDIVQNGVDFDHNDVITALNDGVGVSIAELEQGYTEGTDNVVYGELYVDYTTADNKDSLVQKSWGLMDVVSADDGLTVENGEIRVTADGTVVLSDGETTINIVITGYQASVQKVLGDGATIEALEGELPMGASASYEDLSDKADELAETYNLIPEQTEEEKKEIGFSAFDVAVTVPSGEYDAEGSFAVTVFHEVEIPEGAKVEMFHIHDVDGEIKAELVENATVEDGKVSFVTDGFSEYVIRYTVDFHYEGVDYSMPGSTQILLSDLIENLNIVDANGQSIDVLDVESVAFTDDHLVTVEQVSGLITYNEMTNYDVGEKDFLLTSLEPFHSDEILLITLTSGEEIVVGVTDASEVNLMTLTGSTSNIQISESTTPTEGGYSRTGTYSVHVTYTIDNDQLALARANNTWVYDLSSFFNDPNVPFSSFPDGVSQSGLITEDNRTRGRYYIAGNKIYLEMDQGYINATTDLTGTVDITLQIDETKAGTQQSSTFTFPGSADELTIPFKNVGVTESWKNANNATTGIVAVQQKNGNYKLNYTASVRPNASMDTLVMDDTMGVGQTLDKSSFVIKSESGKTYTVPSSAITDTDNGFKLDIAAVVKAAGDTIKSGTRYEVTYSTNVDADKLEGNTEITNKIDWKWNGGSEPTNMTTVKPKRATSVKKGVVSKNNASDDYLYTFDYTITVGDTTITDVSGVKVSDNMMDYQELDGNIVVKNSSGTIVHTMSDTEIKWVNDTTYGENQKPLFEYTFPEGSNEGPYTITYSTIVPKNVGRGGDVNITNNVNTDDGGSDSTGVPVNFPNPPSPGAKIDKSFEGWVSEDANHRVTSKWSIDVNVDAKEEDLPLRNVVVTESDCFTATAGWYPKTDAVIDYSSIVVKDKETGETIPSSNYQVDQSAGTIKFDSLSNSVTIELQATGAEAMPENGWFENSASLTVNGKPAGSDKDNRQYGTMTFNKSVSYSEEEDVFTWTVTLNELKNEVTPDTPVYFSDLLPEGMQLLNWTTGGPDDPSINVNVGGEVYDNWNQSVTVQGREIQRVNITPWTDYTKTEHKSAGFSKNTYTITYKTRLTDAEMASFASDDDGIKTYLNTAYYYKTEEGPYDGQAVRDVTYEYKVVDKTLVSVNDDHIYYRIEINPKGLRLNDGQEMTLVDTLISTNIDLDLDSVTITDEKGKGVVGATAVYNDDKRTLTITVPDEMRVFLNYAVIAQNIGELTLKNKAELKGNKTWTEEDTSTRTVAKHSGTISGTANIKLSKIDENYTVNPETGATSPKELEGAKFAVYRQPLDFEMTVNREQVDTQWVATLYGDPSGSGAFQGEAVRVNRDGETDSVFTSDGKGMVDLSALPFDKYNALYYWVETDAPDGYELDNTKHYFVLYDSHKDSEKENSNKAIADKLDKKAEEANGIIINKLATGSTWTVVNRTDGLTVDVTKAWKDSAGNDKEFTEEKKVYFKLYQVKGDANGTVYDPTSIDPSFTDDHYNSTKRVWSIAYDPTKQKWETVNISGLPEQADGLPCKYYVVEVSQNGLPLSSLKDYLVSYKAGSNQPKQDASEATLGRNGSIIITNSDLMSIKARKVWRDGGNADGIRPTSITLHLVQDGKQMDISYDRTVEDDGSGKWETEWTRLESGHTYTVVEDALATYDVTYSPAAGLTDEGTIVVTNTDRRKSLTVNKSWVKSNNEGKYVTATAPANGKIVVQLKKNGEMIDEQVLTGPEWSHTWKIMDYEDSDVFAVEEVPDLELFTYVNTVYYDAKGYDYYHAYNEEKGKEMAYNPNANPNEWWNYWIDPSNTSQYVRYKQPQLDGKVVIRNTPFEPDETKAQVVVRKLWVDDEGNELPSKDVADKTATVKLMKYRTEKVGTIIHFINLSDGKSVRENEKVGNGLFRIVFENVVAKTASRDLAGMGDYNTARGNKPNNLSNNCNIDYADPNTKYLSFDVVGERDIYVYFVGNPGNITVTDSEAAGDDIITGPFDTGVSKTLSAPNFRDQFYDLPLTETEEGKTYELSYTVEEDPSVSGFTVSYSADGETFKPALTADDAASGEGESTLTVKNTFIPLDNKVTVEKQWVMSGGASWPTDVSVKVTLMQSVNGSTPTAVTLPANCSERNNPATLSAAKTSTTWDKLPLKEGDYDIVYTVEETAVEGMTNYAERFTTTENVSENGRHVVITNHERPVTIPVEKTWSPLLPSGTTWQATFQLQRQLRLAAVDGVAATRDQYMSVEGVDDKGWSPAKDVDGKTVILTQDNDSDSTTFADLPTVVKIENKTYVVKYTVKETGLTVNDDDMLVSYEATVKGASPDDGYDISVVNKPATVNVPVEKTWDDFTAEEFDWSVKFRLQWAPIYEGASEVSGNFLDVQPIKEMTITKEMMDEGEYSLGRRTFKNLPKYGKDSNGDYRIQYSLEEMEYTVKQNDQVLYTYSKASGYNTENEATHYEAFYPHDAGELDADNSDYYIQVTNHQRNTQDKKYIDIQLNKIWDGYEDDDSAYADFQVMRYKHTEYRDMSNAVPGETVKVTLKRANGSVINEIEIPKKSSVHVAATFMPHTNEKNVELEIDGVRQNLHSSQSNLGDELIRSTVFYPESDMTIKVLSGDQYLSGGYYGAQLLNTDSNATVAERDTAYEGPVIRLNKANGWADTVTVLQQETSAGANDGQQNVTVYGYYFVEKRSNPTGFAAKFYEHGSTTIASGDETNRVYGDNMTVDAVNGPASQLVVKKVWRGVPDTTGYPTIKFTLMQGYKAGEGKISANGGLDSNTGEPTGTNFVWPYGMDNAHPNGIYHDIELNEANDWTWVCPETLPTTAASPVNPGDVQEVGYTAVEFPTTGRIGETVWNFYQYYNDDGNTSNVKNRSDGAAITPENDAINGTLTIVNKINDYYQMDIKKQFFMIHDDGAWDNVTAQMCKNVVLGFKVIRRVVRMDGKTFEETGTNKTNWKDYGDEMLVGYGSGGIGDYVLENGRNGFFLESAGGDWHFRIRDEGSESNVVKDYIGLPKTGYYVDDDEDKTPIAVKYEYSFRETGVYKDANRTPYPDWEWYSTITPDRYIGSNGQESEFGIKFANQDGERVANYQASNIKIDKRWAGQPNAKEVYIKIWRQAGNKTPEDFTEIIAKDVNGDYPQNHPAYGNKNWQGYVEDTSIVDTTHNWLILKANKSGDWTTTVNIHNALIGEAGVDEGEHYTYYTQEIGYKDKNGVIHLIAGLDEELISDLVAAGATVDDDEAIDDLETHYTRWLGGAFGAWVERGDPNWVKNAISIGEKDTNKLQTVNVPKMDLTVDKKWFNENGDETTPWQDEIHFQIEQVSTKWLGGEPTSETRKANVKIGGGDVFTISANAAENLHAAIDLVNRAENHYAYNIDTTGTGKAWQFYVDGLYEGYFDENNDEWHCVYTIKEVDTPRSEVTIDNNDVSTDGETVTINNKKTETGSVKITKVFSGIEALPDSFVINASWTDSAGEHNLALKVKGRQPNNVTLTGDGSEGNPYVWTISKIPFGTDVEVTFTENAFDVDGYVVTVSSTSDTAVDNNNPTTTVAVADDAINKGNFTNEYRAVTGGLKAIKQVTGNKVQEDGELAETGVRITNDLADGEYFFRLFAEDKKTKARDADGKLVEDFSIIVEDGESEPVVINNLKPGTYYLMEYNGTNPAVTLNYDWQEIVVVGDINGDDIENSVNPAGLVTVTNRMPMIEVEADKKWVDGTDEETDLGWPTGAQATFGVFAGKSTTPLATVTLTGTATPVEDIPADGDTPAAYEAGRTDDGNETSGDPSSPDSSDTTVQPENMDAPEQPTQTITGGRAIFKNLPQKDKNGDLIVYTIKEIDEPTGFANQNPDGVKDGETITNKQTESKGSLKLRKLVQVNGHAPETNDEKALVDGVYTFTVVGPEDADEPVTMYVQITVSGGVQTSYKVSKKAFDSDDFDEVVDVIAQGENDTGEWAVVPELDEGDYVISETGNKTGMILTGAVRGDEDEEAVSDELTVTVTVTPGDTEAAETNAQASFTNSFLQTEINIYKIDETTRGNDEKPLKGAEFTIKKWNGSNYVVYTTSATEGVATTGDDGMATFDKLEVGEYEIRETKIPDGYIRSATNDIYFKVEYNNTTKGITITRYKTAMSTQFDDDDKVVEVDRDLDDVIQYTMPSTADIGYVTYAPARPAQAGDSEYVEPEPGAGDPAEQPVVPATFTVGNTPGAKLPSTGGPGTTVFYVLGSILTLLALVLLITKKRTDGQEIE